MIQLRSVYDIKTFKAFQKYTLKKIFILAYVCGIILVGVGLSLAFTIKKHYSMYIIVGVLLPIMMHIFYKVLELENLNKNIHLRDTTMQIFTFDEEEIKLEQISRNETFKDKYLYKDIISIIKYKRYYFLYINRSQAFVINNEDYVVGNEEELDELFKKVKGDKFIVKKNSKKIKRYSKV